MARKNEYTFKNFLVKPGCRVDFIPGKGWDTSQTIPFDDMTPDERQYHADKLNRQGLEALGYKVIEPA